MNELIPKEKVELARHHLDRFWHEIFWRRENEQKVSVWTIAFLGAILAFVCGRSEPIEPPQRYILAAFPLILGLMAAWYLFQNWRKGKEIAKLIVDLNKGLGAWTPGYILPGQTLYPKKWEKWGILAGLPAAKAMKKFISDRMSLAYFACILLGTAFCVVGVLIG